jgi:hypothetical protein
LIGLREEPSRRVLLEGWGPLRQCSVLFSICSPWLTKSRRVLLEGWGPLRQCSVLFFICSPWLTKSRRVLLEGFGPARSFGVRALAAAVVGAAVLGGCGSDRYARPAGPAPRYESAPLPPWEGGAALEASSGEAALESEIERALAADAGP